MIPVQYSEQGFFYGGRMSNLWVAFTDGGSRGNPGTAGCGAYVLGPEGQVQEFKKFLGHQTNNYAEYQGLILALEELAKQQVKQVLVKADSQLMVKQMVGEYRVKNENIKPLYKKAKELEQLFENVSYEHVRREQNKDADRLANEAMDEG